MIRLEVANIQTYPKGLRLLRVAIEIFVTSHKIDKCFPQFHLLIIYIRCKYPGSTIHVGIDRNIYDPFSVYMLEPRYGLYYVHRPYDPTQPGISSTHIKLYVLTEMSLLIQHRSRILGFGHQQILFSYELKVPILIWLLKAIASIIPKNKKGTTNNHLIVDQKLAFIANLLFFSYFVISERSLNHDALFCSIWHRFFCSVALNGILHRAELRIKT
jgi:hypothetical protein